jgi:hypothetical protein
MLGYPNDERRRAKLFPNKGNSEFVLDELGHDKTTFHNEVIDSL